MKYTIEDLNVILQEHTEAELTDIQINRKAVNMGRVWSTESRQRASASHKAMAHSGRPRSDSDLAPATKLVYDTPVAANLIDPLIAFSAAGWTQQEMAKELKIGQGTVSRLLRKLRVDGLL